MFCENTLFRVLSVVSVFLSAVIIISAQGTECTVEQIAQLKGRYQGAIEWSPDGQYIAGYYNRIDDTDRLIEESVHIIDSDSFEVVYTIPRGLYITTTSQLVWSPDSRSLAIIPSIGYDIEIWDMDTETSWFLYIPDTDEAFRQVVWSQDNHELAVVSFDRMRYEPRFQLGEIVRIWNVASKQVIDSFDGDLDQVMMIHHDNQWIIAYRSGQDAIVRIMNLIQQEVFYEISSVYLVDFVHAEDELILAYMEVNEDDPSQNRVDVWNVTTNEHLLQTSGDRAIAHSTLNSDMSFIARVAGRDYEVYDLQSGAMLSFPDRRVYLSSQNQYLAVAEQGQGGSVTVSLMGAVTILTFPNGDIVASFPPGYVGMAWSPNHDLLLVKKITSLYLWSLEECNKSTQK